MIRKVLWLGGLSPALAEEASLLCKKEICGENRKPPQKEFGAAASFGGKTRAENTKARLPRKRLFGGFQSALRRFPFFCSEFAGLRRNRQKKQSPVKPWPLLAARFQEAFFPAEQFFRFRKSDGIFQRPPGRQTPGGSGGRFPGFSLQLPAARSEGPGSHLIFFSGLPARGARLS